MPIRLIRTVVAFGVLIVVAAAAYLLIRPGDSAEVRSEQPGTLQSLPNLGPDPQFLQYTGGTFALEDARVQSQRTTGRVFRFEVSTGWVELPPFPKMWLPEAGVTKSGDLVVLGVSCNEDLGLCDQGALSAATLSLGASRWTTQDLGSVDEPDLWSAMFVGSDGDAAVFLERHSIVSLSASGEIRQFGDVAMPYVACAGQGRVSVVTQPDTQESDLESVEFPNVAGAEVWVFELENPQPPTRSPLPIDIADAGVHTAYCLRGEPVLMGDKFGYSLGDHEHKRQPAGDRAVLPEYLGETMETLDGGLLGLETREATLLTPGQPARVAPVGGPEDEKRLITQILSIVPIGSDAFVYRYDTETKSGSIDEQPLRFVEKG